jgi:hypothetical protein
MTTFPKTGHKNYTASLVMRATTDAIFFPQCIRYNDYMMTKSQKAFRRAALRRSKTAWLFCHIFIAMSIGRMME